VVSKFWWSFVLKTTFMNRWRSVWSLLSMFTTSLTTSTRITDGTLLFISHESDIHFLFEFHIYNAQRKVVWSNKDLMFFRFCCVPPSIVWMSLLSDNFHLVILISEILYIVLLWINVVRCTTFCPRFHVFPLWFSNVKKRIIWYHLSLRKKTV